ncbi:MAG: hypothetical protein L6Q84_07375 [Polyangiaceae bacterium]|nr:hypothetical protein [Polyangiaceae bacterium]
MRGLALLLVLAAAVGWVGAARADDVSVRLEYEAPEGCPTAADFQREVETRLDRGRIAGSTDLARTYRVKVTQGDPGTMATLDFTDHDGARAVRDVTGATCSEAVSAIALVTALAIEARVAKDGAQAPAPSPPKPEPEAPPRPPTPPPAPRPAPKSVEPDFVFGFGASVGVEQGFAPKLAPAVAAVGEVLHHSHAARASLRYADTGPAHVDAGIAEFSLYALRISACPLRLMAGSRLALVPCAGLEAGLVRAAGKASERIVEPKSAEELWLAGHALGRVELSPDPGLAFGLEGGVGFPFTRHEFMLEKPDVVVHAVPAVSWSASAGMVARFR